MSYSIVGWIKSSLLFIRTMMKGWNFSNCMYVCVSIIKYKS
jgi:hypothetical protein